MKYKDQYSGWRESNYTDKTVSQLSHLYNKNFYIDNIESSYWNNPCYFIWNFLFHIANISKTDLDDKLPTNHETENINTSQ